MNSVHTENSTSGNQQAIPGWFSFKGRYTRAQFWNRFIPAAVIFGLITSKITSPFVESLAARTLDNGDTGTLFITSALMMLAETIIMTMLYLPLMVKRFHDFGYSAKTPSILWGLHIIINLTAEMWMVCLSVELMEVAQQSSEIAVQLATDFEAKTEYYRYTLGLRGLIVLILLALMCRDSQRGTNKYGPSTKYPDVTEQQNVTETEPPLPPLPTTSEKQRSTTSGCLTMFFIFLGIGVVLAIGLYLLEAGPDAIRYTMIAYGGSIAGCIQTMRQKKK